MTTFTTRAGTRGRILGAVAATVLVLGACGGGGGGSAASFCDVARSFVEASDEADDLLSDDMASPAELRRGLNEARSQIERLERAAPSEIRGDVTTIKNAFVDFVRALESVDFNFFALFSNPEAMERLESLDSPQVEAAGQRINDYARVNCDGLELGFGDDGADDFDFDMGDLDDMFGDLDLEDMFGDLDDMFGDLDDLDFDMGDFDMGDFDMGDLDMDFDMSFMIPMYQEMFGLSEAQASCLVENLVSPDPFTACGIDPSVMAG